MTMSATGQPSLAEVVAERGSGSSELTPRGLGSEKPVAKSTHSTTVGGLF